MDKSADDVPSRVAEETGVCVDSSFTGSAAEDNSFECSSTSYAVDFQKVTNDEDVVLPLQMEVLRETTVSTSRSGRTKRRCRERRESELAVLCPVCRQTLRSTDMDSHLQLEISKLTKIAGRCKKESSSGNRDSPDMKNYLQVKRNRLIRQQAQRRALAEVTDDSGTACPVCSELIMGSPDELNAHADMCLNRACMHRLDFVQSTDCYPQLLQIQQTLEDQDVDIDHLDDPEFEEYEWAGQTRVRASSMLHRESPVSVVMHSVSNDRDDSVDLNIEDDDRVAYGRQHSDDNGEENSRRLLRNAMLECERENIQTDDDVEQHERVANGDNSTTASSPSSKVNASLACEVIGLLKLPVKNLSTCSPKDVVHNLKTRLAEQEKLLSEVPRCLVCMEMYTKPLTSIQCWHVCCEECWLRTLGAKKLCPHCNMITTPSDLRRIYL